MPTPVIGGNVQLAFSGGELTVTPGQINVAESPWVRSRTSPSWTTAKPSPPTTPSRATPSPSCDSSG